jgi:hypothetical protein
VRIGSERVFLDPQRLLGEGGEAVVLAHSSAGQELAVKLYKEPSDSKRAKVEHLAAFAQALPFAKLPRATVIDDRSSSFLGFVMLATQKGAEPWSVLSRADYRAKIGLGRLLAAHLELGRRLSELHSQAVVVGDLNDQNQLYCAKTGAVEFIDADSFQVDGFACDVTSAVTLDPLLFGPALDEPWLTADGLPRWFSRGSDWYAFNVLLFRCLVGIHPYGGLLEAEGSLVRRARARTSVFAAKVVMPAKVRRRLEALPASLLAWFERVFCADERRPFPLAELERAVAELRLCECGEPTFFEGGCAACKPLVQQVAAGELNVREWCPRSATARIVEARVVADQVLLAVLDAGRLFTVTLDSQLEPISEQDLGACSDAVIGLNAEHVLTHSGEQLALIDRRTGERTPSSAEEAFGRPACVLLEHGLARIIRGSVLLPRGAGERVVATVVRNQSRIDGAHGTLLLSTHVFGARRYQIVNGGGTTELAAPALAAGEVVLEECALFDGSTPMVLRRTQHRCEEKLTAISREGTLCVASPPLPSFTLRGALLRGTALLLASDAGLCRVELLHGRSRIFSDSEPFVRGGDRLLAVDSALVVVSGSRLVRLERRSF